MARLHAEPQRPNRTGDQHFACSRLTGLARNFHAPAIQPLHFIAKPQRPELEAIRAERVRLDDLRTRFDVLLVHTKDCFGLRGVQLVEAPLRPHCFV